MVTNKFRVTILSSGILDFDFFKIGDGIFQDKDCYIQTPLIGLPISELAETVKLSEKHSTDAVANRSLPPHAPA
ncbi:MAG: hypothetical protein PHY48_00025 [Candidatus Cloacimonetes bacterium]|nr:hypothetical protein [Candidatus Cloacimonadota bacterium]